jgi:hypothetical protein
VTAFQITAERFHSGMTYAAYKAQMTTRRDEFEDSERALVLDPEDVAAFVDLPQPLNVVVLDEDWCQDGIYYLPLLGRLAGESGKLNIRVFLRDQNLDLMEQCLYQNTFQSIPVFIFLNDFFNEVGRFIERPAAARALIETLTPAFPQLFPDVDLSASPALWPEDVRAQVMKVGKRVMDSYRPYYQRAALHELRVIAEQQRVPLQLARAYAGDS